VEQLIPLSIVSVSPRNEFFQRLSWEIDVGWRARLAAGRPLVFGVHGGRPRPGRFPILRSRTMVYAFLESTLQVNTTWR